MDDSRITGPARHFAGAGKMIELGKGGEREVPDSHLSRFACYLIARNGGPRKPEVAHAQEYVAVQTRCLDALAGRGVLARVGTTGKGTHYVLSRKGLTKGS